MFGGVLDFRPGAVTRAGVFAYGKDAAVPVGMIGGCREYIEGGEGGTRDNCECFRGTI